MKKEEEKPKHARDEAQVVVDAGGRAKSDIALREEEILARWNDQHIFEKTLEQTSKGEKFSFNDGPPFATGMPHYGHILASTIKDAIPRYQTMRGRSVRRVWGWDCHGLPIENLIEGELGLEHKKDIEQYGIGKFNDAARASVLRYDSEWKKIIPRIGRWIDMEHSYKTMDASYTESIWWAFKTLHEKGLIYQGFKSMHICPRCETTLSNNEVADGYKDITDISVTAKFELADPVRTNGSTDPASNGAGEPKTYVLAWTTTPWTLPGNVALAVNSGAVYVKIQNSKVKSEIQNSKLKDGEIYILAKERLGEVLKGEEYDVIEEFKGSDFVGKSYKPIFDHYAKNETLSNREHGWKIYGADFVTMDSGTGIVHIAPAFGEDDMALGIRERLPFVQHVAMDGTIRPEVREFAGLSAKPKSKEKDGPSTGSTNSPQSSSGQAHQATDILIIKHLAGINALFSKDKIVHAYPHCWRCETPLLNYAAESWFVKVTALKEKLIAENAKTSWIPAHMRDGRFGKWLENARDWAISRSRFWGAPLPVWQCATCDERMIIGSYAELATRTRKSGNRYLVMRHGEAESNVRGIVSSKLATNASFGLTEKGKAAARATAERLRTETIDRIIVSPFLRTTQTAGIVAEVVGFDATKIIVDERLKEIDTGIFDGQSIDAYHNHFASLEEKVTKRPSEGENLLDVKRRVMELLEEIEKTERDTTILLITHEYPTWLLTAGSEGASPSRVLEMKRGRDDFIETGEVRELPFTLFPHNTEFEYDTHRPSIDEVPVVCTDGHAMTRVPYVFDCWFESGSMPFAQFHYPFENEAVFEKNFPADFIAEGVDQTRGWFYNTLNLSVGLFDKAPFRNVVVNGMILAEDGQKMSKRLKNYPDPQYIVDRYGADAMRYYLLSSPVVRAEDLSFSEKGVDEVVKKVSMRLLNVLSFYELHAAQEEVREEESNNVLDRWILARLAELGTEITRALDAYELDRAVKPISLFIDDLSTWYLRRSRERFKSDDVADRMAASQTTRTVLCELAKLIAPIMPFLAEHVYQKVKRQKPNVKSLESVHLETWPKFDDADEATLSSMAEVRRVVSLALEARAKAGVKVRQPLQTLKVKSEKLKVEYFEIIKDEVNVKEVVLDDSITGEVIIDTTITPELEREGLLRDFVRAIRESRKQAGLTPADMATLIVGTGDDGRALLAGFENEIKKSTFLREIVYGKAVGDFFPIGGCSFDFELKK